MIITDIQTKQRYEINLSHPTGENTMTCPVCSASRKKKLDKCFSWNADKRMGYCSHCEAKFMAVAVNELRERDVKEYYLPKWENKTELSLKAVNWFTGRMISQQTLKEMRVYSGTQFMPQIGKECEVMCFPYFVNGELKNIKYRGPNKSFMMVKGAELVFYNFDCIADSKSLIICEGEMDALSFIDAGLKNVVSVPNGAGATNLTYLDNYIDVLSHIEKFYIAADFDDAGLKLRTELIRRLGQDKCMIVTYKGRKDANELMMREGGLALQEIINTAAEIPIRGYIDLNDRYDNIYSMYQHGLPEGLRIGVPEIDECIRWELDRLAIWTGIPSHGKSEMIDFVTVKLAIAHGWKTLFFSPENYPIENHYSKIAEKIIGKSFRQTDMSYVEFEQAFEYIETHFFWLDPYEEPTLENILSRAALFIKRKGIKQLVIDPFNCLEHKRDKSETGSEYIGRFLDELSRFAKLNGILIHLVAHPTKLEKLANSASGGVYPPPTLYDISGSSNFYNKADYGITVYRDFEANTTKFIITKVRFKNAGHPTRSGVLLQYNTRNGRYEPPTGDVYLLDNANYLTPPNNDDASEDLLLQQETTLPF